MIRQSLNELNLFVVFNKDFTDKWVIAVSSEDIEFIVDRLDMLYDIYGEKNIRVFYFGDSIPKNEKVVLSTTFPILLYVVISCDVLGRWEVSFTSESKAEAEDRAIITQGILGADSVKLFKIGD